MIAQKLGKFKIKNTHESLETLTTTCAFTYYSVYFFLSDREAETHTNLTPRKTSLACQNLPLQARGGYYIMP